MKPEISVIVPVYNVKEYLEQCLNSVLAQTFRNFELIVVDDGSTDGSGELCDRFLRRDARVRVVHQPNGGLSAARNRGIELSTAPFITFIDSDDYAAPDMLEFLYGLITRENADVSVCGFYRVKSKSISCHKNPFRATMSGREFLKMILIGKTASVFICGRLFRRQCFRRLRFPVGKTVEDGYVAVDLYPSLARVAVDMQPKYYYRLREGSITTSTSAPTNQDIVDAYERCLSIVEKEYPECVDAAKMRLLRSYFVVYDKMLTVRLPEAEELRKTILTFGADILRNPYVYPTRKLGLLLLAYSAGAYRACMIRYENFVDQRSLR